MVSRLDSCFTYWSVAPNVVTLLIFVYASMVRFFSGCALGSKSEMHSAVPNVLSSVAVPRVHEDLERIWDAIRVHWSRSAWSSSEWRQEHWLCACMRFSSAFGKQRLVLVHVLCLGSAAHICFDSFHELDNVSLPGR